MIIITHYITVFAECCDRQKRSRVQPSSIERFRQPVEGLVRTETLTAIRKRIKEERTVILHCHGVPGSGKSQVVRKMSQEFPFNSSHLEKDDVLIRWHIQCSDSGHNVQEELKDLSRRILQNSFSVTEEQCQNVIDNLKMNEAGKLVNLLVEIEKNVLIIIEDPSEDDQKILHSLCRNLSKSVSLPSKKIHLYIATRKSKSFLSPNQKVNCYKLEIVKGFNEQEAVSFLDGEVSEEERAAAAKIHKRFGGLPLGLLAARGYCKTARIDYSEYFEVVEDVNYDIIEEEKNACRQEYGNKAEHVFQALVMPFMPNDEDDTTAILHWKILSCISYFHYDRIPRFALEQCCHMLRNVEVKKPGVKNKVDIGNLISKLRVHGMCTETDKGEITFHEVVSNAFRLNQHSILKDDFNPLRKAMEIMCNLVSKDLRKKGQSAKMYKLRRHLESVLNHIEKDEYFYKDQEDEVLLKALTSHLHEATAAIMLSESPQLRKISDEHFKKALALLWPEMDKYSKLNICECDKRKLEFAQNIVSLSKDKGCKLPFDFTFKYASKLEFCFDDEEIEFLKSKSNSEKCFKEVEKAIKEKKSTEILVKNLQNCGLFLSNDKYCRIFYAARLASILHSWSRLVLYGDLDEVNEKGEKCICMSNVSHCVSIECKNSFGVSLLSERLSKIGGWVPILLKLKRPAEELRAALDTCEKALCNQNLDDMFENGLLKEVSGPLTFNAGPSKTASRISLLKLIVRINARLQNGSNAKAVLVAHQRCDELLKLSTANAQTVSACLMCLIYCAKYYAAKNKFDESLKCFDKYFEMELICKPRYSIHCWAIYNHARAVSKYESCPSAVKVAAVEKCKLILQKKDTIQISLREKLSLLIKGWRH